MPCTIHVNGTANSLIHKGSNGVASSTIPDVCKTPSPGGPVPIPYPVIVSLSSDVANGSTTVKFDGGNMAAIKGCEFSRCTGDEAGTAGGVASNTFGKEAKFILYSFDVKIDGGNACRLGDKMTMNHQNTMCLMGATNPAVAGSSLQNEDDLCPCCKQPRHSNQKSADGKKNLPKIKEADWYQKQAKKSKGATAVQAQQALDNLKKARGHTPPCPNLHNPPDEGCGTHFDKTEGPRTQEVKARNDWPTVRSDYIKDARARGINVANNAKVNHLTPVSSGGCPSSPKNLMVDAEFPDQACQDAEAAQTFLQGLN